MRCATARRGYAGWWCGPTIAARASAAGCWRRSNGSPARDRRGRLWVFTESAAAFYEHCGWQRHGESEQDGEPGIVLTRVLS